MLIHSPAGTFDAADRQRVASALMTLGLDCERLPHSPLVRSTVWTYFSDYQADAVFMGDEPARLPVVTLQIYVLRAGGAYRESGPVANARRSRGGADPCCRGRHGDDLACTSRGRARPAAIARDAGCRTRIHRYELAQAGPCRSGIIGGRTAGSPRSPRLSQRGCEGSCKKVRRRSSNFRDCSFVTVDDGRRGLSALHVIRPSVVKHPFVVHPGWRQGFPP